MSIFIYFLIFIECIILSIMPHELSAANLYTTIGKGIGVMDDATQISKLKTVAKLSDLSVKDLPKGSKAENIQNIMHLAVKEGRVGFSKQFVLIKKYNEVNAGDVKLLMCLKNIKCDVFRSLKRSKSAANNGQKTPPLNRLKGDSTTSAKSDLVVLNKRTPQQHRNELKNNMKKNSKGNGKAKGNGNGACKKGFEAHHAVPVSVGKNWASKCSQLANPHSPYYINSANNGVCLPKSTEVRGTYKGAPIHAPNSHKDNISNVNRSLENAYESGGCKALYKQASCIQSQTRQSTTASVGNIKFRVCK